MNRKTSTASKLPKKFQDDFLKYAEPLHFLAHEVIFHEGDSDRSLYLLTEGALQVSKKRSGNQSNKIVAELYAGDVFGEINFVFGSQRTASIHTAEPSIVYRLTLAQSKKIIHESGDFYTFLQTIGTKRWVESMLATLDLFSDLPPNTLQGLLAGGDTRTISSGIQLYPQGHKIGKIYILLSGMIELHHNDGRIIDPEKGDNITPIEVTENKPSPWYASTVSECIVLSLPLAMVLQEASTNKPFAKKLQSSLIV